MSFKDKLDTLANTLLDYAGKQSTPYSERLDAFKELRAYYALTLKESKPEEDDGTSFNAFHRKVQQAEQANGEVRSRRREHS